MSGHVVPAGPFGPSISHSLCAASTCAKTPSQETYVVHTLRGEGFDASEDGTGRGIPLVPIVLQEGAVIENPKAGPQGKGWQEDLAYTPEARHRPQMVYDMRGNGNGNVSPTLTKEAAGDRPSDYAPVVLSFTAGNLARGEGPRPSTSVFPTLGKDAGDQHPCIFQQNSRSEVRSLGDKAGTVAAEPGAQCQNYLKTGMAVRRLTPVECARLQGFPDYHTRIPWRGKDSLSCPDGPQYKAIGNSWAVPVVTWIGRRIAEYEEVAGLVDSL